MSDDNDFERHLAEQFPFRPSHPDFQRLQEVVKQVEAWKADRVDPEAAYASIADLISVTYMGVQRAGMNLPPASASRKQVTNYMANAWVEGFLYGVLFQQLGGRQVTDDDITGGG
ncbi:MAG TPA: hypothetical protein VE326_11275 [Candidatus Binatia bacterium]|nr:hypothetical protein [Candidatus Binatia bacterium]